MNAPQCHGLLAEFASEDALLAAVRGLRAQGYARLEAYTPYAIEGLVDALGAQRAPLRSRLAFWVLLGGLCGGLGMLALQYYAAAVAYPINVGGRPDASWPAFLPAALEMTILFAAVFGVLAMLLANGLPRLHHPLFAVQRFERASRDGLFVLVRADDATFDRARTPRDLGALDALHVDEVPA